MLNDRNCTLNQRKYEMLIVQKCCLLQCFLFIIYRLYQSGRTNVDCGVEKSDDGYHFFSIVFQIAIECVCITVSHIFSPFTDIL